MLDIADELFGGVFAVWLPTNHAVAPTRITTSRPNPYPLHLRNHERGVGRVMTQFVPVK